MKSISYAEAKVSPKAEAAGSTPAGCANLFKDLEDIQNLLK